MKYLKVYKFVGSPFIINGCVLPLKVLNQWENPTNLNMSKMGEFLTFVNLNLDASYMDLNSLNYLKSSSCLKTY